VETVVVAASRGADFSLSEMEMLVGSAVVLAVLVWAALSRARRGRSQRHA